MKIGFGLILVWLSVVVFFMTGYVLNILHFISGFGVWSGTEVVRLIGIIIPVVGAIVGWLA